MVSVKDVCVYLDYCRCTPTMKRLKEPKWRFLMQTRREINCFNELCAQLECSGLSILLPAEPYTCVDEGIFLETVCDLFWVSKMLDHAPHLQSLICRDDLYITILASHLRDCNTIPNCFPKHVVMAGYVSRYLNSKSAFHVLNSNFLQELVAMVRSNRQHIVLSALRALVPLFAVGKKHLKKIVTQLCSIEVGLTLTISHVLRQYAANGLRKMEICDCTTSATFSKDCVTLCMENLVKVIFWRKAST